MMALVLLAGGCGAAAPPPPAPVVVVATPDAGPVRPTREACATVMTRLWTGAAPPSPAAVEEFVADCQTHSTQAEVDCALAAEDPVTLSNCGGFRESP